MDELFLNCEELKVKCARLQVEMEKYKLKALESEKYWSTTVQQLNNKHKQETSLR